MGEVEKLDPMEHWDRRAARDLGDAADVAGGDEIGRDLHDIRDLAVAQPQSDLRLQNIIGARRTAAQMPFENIADPKTCMRQEPPWQGASVGSNRAIMLDLTN